jgi:PAS domain S-box-containing protein
VSPGYSLLYVDDEPDLLELATVLLEESGEFSLTTRKSAREALETLKLGHFDAVISDYQMPDMDGITFLKEVRSILADIPFIIFTGRGREEVVIEALNNGADFYLQKGGNPEAVYAELSHVIKKAIQMRQAQLTIAEQEQRYHDLQNANDLIQSVSPEGRLLFVNKKWQDTLGYHGDETDRITLFDIIHEESMEHCRMLFPRVLAGEDVGIIDVVFKARDGRKVYVEGFASCKITDGKPQYTRGIFKDVTDRKKAEAQLKESEEKFRTLVEHLLDGILIISPSGTILFANQAAGTIIEKTDYRGLFGSGSVMDFIAAESREDVERDFRNVAGGADGFPAHYKIITALRRERWVESTGKSILFEGRPAILVSLRDITDRKRSESVMRENEEKFRSIFENSPYPIAINSMPDQKFIAINPAFVRVSGYQEEEVLGKNPVELGLLSFTEAARLVSRAVLSGKIENVPLALTAKAGKMVHVIFSTIPITIGSRPASMTITAEVTQMRRVEEELIKKTEDLHSAYEELTATEEELRQNYDALRKQEQALKVSEEKYRLLTEVTSDVIYLIDPLGTVTHISPQITRYGYVPEEVISHNFTEFIAEEDIPQAAADMKKTLSTGKTMMTRVRVRDKTGGIHWLEDNGAPVYDDAGSVIAISGILRDVTERKRIEDALRESEEKFRALVETSPNMIWETDLQGKFRYVSPMIGTLMGYSPEEIIGKSIADVVTDQARPRVMQEMARVMSSEGIIPPMQFPTYHRDGHEMTIEIRVARIAGPDGKPVGFRGIAVDITERRKTEDALRESEEKFRALVENSLEGIFIIDFTGILRFANQAAGRIIDYPDYQELIGTKNVMEFVSPESQAEVLKDLRQVAGGTDAYLVEYKLVTGKGREIWVECIGKKIFFRSGEVMLVSMRDVTGRKESEIARARIESALRESEVKFRTLAEHSFDGIMILNEAGKILFRNRAAATIVDVDYDLGKSGEKNALEYIAPESREAALRDLDLVKKGTSSYPVSYPAITGRGKRIWVECIGKQITFQNAPAILISFRDISSRKQMEDALIRTNRQLSLLSSITRHDVLNKIAVIQGHLSLSQKKGAGQDYPALIQKIGTTVETIRGQVEFTRVYQNLGTKEPEWQSLSKVLASVHLPDSVLLQNSLGGLEVYADLMLEKVFFNLIDNSLRHGERVTEIRLEYRPDPEGLAIIFEDNGIGIPAHEKEKIFERGYGKNTGLGLFLAREILGITGIAIQETGDEGKGARFEIRVPQNAYRLPSA